MTTPESLNNLGTNPPSLSMFSNFKENIERWADAFFCLENSKLYEDKENLSTLLEVSGKYITSVEPIHLFCSISDTWKMIWRGKQDKTLFLGFNSTCFSDSLSQSELPHFGDIGWFGGMPFHEGQDESSDWGEFKKRLFFIPEFLFEIENDPTTPVTLKVRGLIGKDQNKVSLIRFMREKFIAFLTQSFSKEGSKSFDLTKEQKPIEETHIPNFQTWQETFKKAESEINKGNLEKVVLSRKKRLSWQKKVSPVQVMKNLLKEHPKSYLFAISSPTNRLFTGVSPERLIRWKNESEVEVDAIAGTRKVCDELTETLELKNHLMVSKKDLAEHRSVTKFVGQALKESCHSYDQVIKEKVLTLKNVQHILSQFKGELKPKIPALSMMLKLHPTPAVGGRPSQKAVDFIACEESFERGWFAGAIGYFSKTEGEFAIGIRSALIHNNWMDIFAGAGIVNGSNAQSEWQETEIKMKNFYEIFMDKN